MPVYKRPPRSDELYHSKQKRTLWKNRNNPLYAIVHPDEVRRMGLEDTREHKNDGPKSAASYQSELDRINSEINKIKYTIANPTKKEAAYIDSYKRKLQSLIEDRKALRGW